MQLVRAVGASTC